MKLKLPKFKFKEEDILPLSVAVLTGIQVIQALALFLLAISFYGLTKQAQPTLVQRNDGTAFAAEPKPANYRKPEVIRQFVKDWASLQFTWSGKLPSSKGEGTIKDEGITVGGSSVFAWKGKKNSSSEKESGRSSGLGNPSVLAPSFLGQQKAKVPTLAWQAALLLPEFEQLPFLQILAKDWVPKDYFTATNPTTTVLNFDYIGEPQLIDRERGIWSVELLTTITYRSDDAPVGEVRNFDKTIIVAPVEPPKEPLAPTATLYEQIVYQMRSRRLQIVKFQPSSVRKDVEQIPNSN